MLPQNTWCVCFHVHIGGILAFLWFWWHEYLGAVYSLIKAEYERQKTQFHGESVIKGSSPTSDLIFQDGQILKPVKGQIFVSYSKIFFIVIIEPDVWDQDSECLILSRQSFSCADNFRKHYVSTFSVENQMTFLPPFLILLLYLTKNAGK